MLILSDVVSTRDVVRRQGWLSSGDGVGEVGAGESVAESSGAGVVGAWV